MAIVINRLTKRLIKSVNTPDYSISEWIIDPDLSAVINQPAKYWIITDDIVSLMDQAAMDIVDADEVQAAKDSLEAESDIGILKAVIAALIKTVNIRLPDGQKITKAEMISAIRGEL